MDLLSSDKILTVDSISKHFSGVHALDEISFSVEKGDVFAFLGPNGAGKTTTIRILLDIIKADKGRIEFNLNGMKSHLPSPHTIGYLPEERGLYLDVPIIRSLVYMASIRGTDPSTAKKRAMEWLEKLELADRAKQKLQALSKGNQQKIQFIASILHQPAFAILDEPFSGFDPVNQEKFIEIMKELNEQGMTILLSAHQMALVERIANKIFLINKGREVFQGPLKDVYHVFGEHQILDVKFKAPVNPERFQVIPAIERAEANNGNIRIFLTKDTNINQVLTDFAAVEEITHITSYKPDLHTIFLDLIKKQ